MSFVLEIKKGTQRAQRSQRLLLLLLLLCFSDKMYARIVSMQGMDFHAKRGNRIYIPLCSLRFSATSAFLYTVEYLQNFFGYPE